MSVIKKMRRQRAVYWEQNGIDRYGKLSYLKAVEIRCRWDDGVVDARSAEGATLSFNATVYVDREMKVGDMLKKGELESADNHNNPTSDPEAKRIQRFSITPNFKATENLYTALL